MKFDYDSFGVANTNVSCVYSERGAITHSHNFIECFLVIKGTSPHKLNGKIDNIVEGDLILMNLTDEHCFPPTSKTFCAHRDILIKDDYFRSCCNNISPDLYARFAENKYVKKISLSYGEWLSLQKYLFSLNSCIKTNRDLANQLSFIIVNKILSYYVEESLVYNSKYPDWFVLFLECFSNPTLLREGAKSIANLFNFSYEHICREFKKYMGETIVHYLNRRRIDEAKVLLEKSSFNLNEIQQKVGINSQSHFNKLFKEFVGVSPKDYKISLKYEEKL